MKEEEYLHCRVYTQQLFDPIYEPYPVLFSVNTGPSCGVHMPLDIFEEQIMIILKWNDAVV